MRFGIMWGKPHKNGCMSYVECRMLPINAMVLVCISQLHFTQVKHQSRYGSSVFDIYGYDTYLVCAIIGCAIAQYHACMTVMYEENSLTL